MWPILDCPVLIMALFRHTLAYTLLLRYHKLRRHSEISEQRAQKGHGDSPFPLGVGAGSSRMEGRIRDSQEFSVRCLSSSKMTGPVVGFKV